MDDMRPFGLVGIGFGPQGVAMAAALEDLGERHGVRMADQVAFFEKAPGSGWQTGMLLRNADIQHHYFRDLATPRDPRSRFTFANFLKEKDRIYEFGSLVYGGGGGAVSRIEWSEYVGWAADLLEDYVTYDSPVDAVRRASADGEDLLAVTVGDREVLARAVVYCAGRDLRYPPQFVEHLGDRVFHSTKFLHRLAELPDLNGREVAVVGAGQSSIEITQYLHSTFPRTRIACLHRAVGFHHGNHSPFVQRMFHPKESDYFFSLPAAGRRDLLAEVMRSNYASVDREAVSALNRTIYEDRLLGAERIQMVPSSEVDGVVRDSDGRYRIDTVNRLDGSHTEVTADVIVLATGYQAEPLPRVLESLRQGTRVDELGNPEVAYDFSLVTRAADAPVFVPSAGEPSHGLAASTSFSMVALKAERVTKALLAHELLAAGKAPRGAGRPALGAGRSPASAVR